MTDPTPTTPAPVDPDDVDGVELTAESDDPQPVLPPADSPIAHEDTIQPGSTDPEL